MPGAGHIVHMPAHIYIRVGRYDDAIEATSTRCTPTRRTSRARSRRGCTRSATTRTTIHFLAFAATLAGRSSAGDRGGAEVAAKVPAEVARQAPPLEALVPYAPLTLVDLRAVGRGAGASRCRPRTCGCSTGLAYYARGVAHAAKGQWPQAQAALDSVKAIASGTTPHDQVAMTRQGENKTIMEIAMHALMGEIAERRGQNDAAMPLPRGRAAPGRASTTSSRRSGTIRCVTPSVRCCSSAGKPLKRSESTERTS